MEPIVNKVAESGIMTLDLAPYIPADDEMMLFDLKPFLFMEMILKEKDYRAALQSHNWAQYAGKHVALTCTADAVIPLWAYMLAASYLQPEAASVYFGSLSQLKDHLVANSIAAIDKNEYTDKRVVIKGCGDISIPESAYIAITFLLKPVVRSLMYGEPCSTVPVYKKKPGAAID